MNQFNKFIAVAVLVVASNVKSAEAPAAVAAPAATAAAAATEVSKAVEAAKGVAAAAPATTDAAAPAAAAAATGWFASVKGSFTKAGKAVTSAANDGWKEAQSFGKDSAKLVSDHKVATAVVATLVIAGVSYAVYKCHQAKKAKQTKNNNCDSAVCVVA